MDRGDEQNHSGGADLGLPPGSDELPPRTALGRFGEALAERHLVGLGMVVLDRNWRCPVGEADLVLLDGGVLVVCEVKTRSGERFGPPAEAVTRAKVARLRRLVGVYRGEHPELRPQGMRVDVVGIVRTTAGRVTLRYLRGVGA